MLCTPPGIRTVDWVLWTPLVAWPVGVRIWTVPWPPEIEPPGITIWMVPGSLFEGKIGNRMVCRSPIGEGWKDEVEEFSSPARMGPRLARPTKAELLVSGTMLKELVPVNVLRKAL